MLKVVVFDCDGTLMDSVELFFAAHSHAAKKHGGTPPSREQFRAVALKGISLQQMFEEMQPDKDHAAMVVANGEYLLDHLTDAQPFDHLEETLEKIKSMGLEIALLTGGNHRVHDVLEHHTLSDHFTSIVHSGRIVHPKPDPEGLLLAAKECGVQPEEVVMVGDTIADIGAGRSGGALATIGVTHGVSTRKQLQEAGADYIIDSLLEIIPILDKLAR